MEGSIDLFALELNKTLKSLEKTSRVNIVNEVKTEVYNFISEIEDQVFKNIKFLQKAYITHLENLKTPTSRKTEILDAIYKMVADGHLFSDTNISEGDKEVIIKINFVNRKIAKDFLTLYEYGSGTLKVPTTRFVWKKTKALREKLKSNIELIL